MSNKIGRNDPCPCGSGKKYKHCHRRSEAATPEPPAQSHGDAVGHVLGWLMQRHRKAFMAAFESLLDDLLPDDIPQRALGDLDKEEWSVIQINLSELLLAEGDFKVKGHFQDVSELLLGPEGPRLSETQRSWLVQLAGRPLRLYTVTEVMPGEGMRLCDALAQDAAPVLVRERMGSQSVRPGMLLGCRVMAVDAHFELSGAIYSFTPLAQAGVLDVVRNHEQSTGHPEGKAMMVSLTIAEEWLRQFFQPPTMPQILDASTGEPVLLVTDHYRVHDAEALRLALSGCADVSADQGGGWARQSHDADGMVRQFVSINPGRQADRIEVFYRTQHLADDGRTWFDALAGAAVQFITREISDPRGALSKGPVGGAAGAGAAVDLRPEVLADVVEKALLRSYANWADEPIPALDGRTPRQAIATPAGLERVKGLLRSYEDGEVDMAARDGRRTISYQFLWDALGIAR
jgi:hypothetical protein